jgi:hypothetical protein
MPIKLLLLACLVAAGLSGCGPGREASPGPGSGVPQNAETGEPAPQTSPGEFPPPPGPSGN